MSAWVSVKLRDIKLCTGGRLERERRASARSNGRPAACAAGAREWYPVSCVACAAASQLQAVFRRAKHFAGRHVDDAHRHGWLVYRLTGSPLLLGMVGFAGQIPTFLFAPFAGVWVDRLDRRQVLVWTQALAIVQSLLLAALTLSGHITIHSALSVFQGLINAFDMPGRQAFLVQMVEDRQDLGNAIAINSSMVNLARLVGPSLAGLVIAATTRAIVS